VSLLRLLVRTPLVRLLWAAPRLELTDAKRRAFERGEVDAYPKHEYLRWLVATADPPVLLHGSATDIEVFEPREQTDWDGRLTRAIFATSDGIWPIFFAIADRRAVRSLRNGCLSTRNGSRYWFSVEPRPGAANVWRDGYVYVLPRAPFRPHSLGTEWTAPVAVRPIRRVAVSPHDFPFLDRVGRHDHTEPVARTLWQAVRSRP
jgi:hypothetical protein